MALKLITPPEKQPLTLDEARAHLRVDHDEEDTYIQSQIAAATNDCQDFAGRQFITATYILQLDCFPRSGIIHVPMPPLQSVESIEYVDTSGTTQVLDPSRYRVDSISEPARITPAYGTVWPSTLGVTGAVTVEFIAGYGDDEDDVPEWARSAIRLTLGNLFENREAVIVGVNATEMPQSAEHLLWKHRILTNL